MGNAFIPLALSALALAPNAVPTPYADAVHAILPKAIAGAAFLLFVAILADRPNAAPARTAAEVVSPVATAPIANQANSEVVNFLAILQEGGRLVDFLMDDITGGAVADVVEIRMTLPPEFSYRLQIRVT